MTTYQSVFMPDRTYQAFDGQQTAESKEAMAEFLTRLTFHIGNRTLESPVAANIYRQARIENHADQALHLLQTGLAAPHATHDDLQDLLWLFDDTAQLSLEAVRTGQWDVHFRDRSGDPSTDLLRRVTQPRCQYGLIDHYNEALGYREPNAPRGLFVRFVGSPVEEVVTTESQVSDLCGYGLRCFAATIPSQRQRASSREGYRGLFIAGYSSFSNANPHAARDFLRMLSGATWQQMDQAASQAAGELVSESAIPRNHRRAAYLGLRDLFGAQQRLSRLRDAVAGAGLGRNALVPVANTQLRGYSESERSRAALSARTWATQALTAVQGASQIDADLRDDYRRRIVVAREYYLWALHGGRHAIPPACRSLYYNHLAAHPSDIWGAYEAIQPCCTRELRESPSFGLV